MSAELIFEIDVVSPEILMEEIDRYNHMHGTDFIIEKIHEETEIFFAKSEQQPLQKIFLV